MTNQLYGSSLFQARKTDHAHRHSHLHDRKINRHLHSHAEFHSRHEEESKPDDQLQRRDSAVTEIVQTISVVQVIDGSGATVEVQTVSATPQTNLIDGDTGSTIRTNFKAMSLTSNSAEASTTASSSASASETPSHETPVYSVDPVGVSAEPSSTSSSTSPTDASSSSSTTTSAESSGAITSVAPAFSSTTSSSFPSLSSVSNSTTSSFTSSFPYSPSSSLISTTYTLPNSTVTTDTWVASSTLFQSSLTALGTSLSSEATYSGYTSSGSAYSSPTSGTASTYGSSASADPSSTGWSSYSDSATSTYDAGSSDGSGATGVYATPSSSTSASSGSSNTTSTSTSTAAPTSTVVGGVVGGLAGLALLVAFAFMLVRLRKRGWGPLRLGGDGSTPAATITNPSPGPSTGPSTGPSSGDAAAGNSAYGTMQRTAPYSVASSLAALAGGKRASRERAGSGPEMAERGFVRVSGKKLPPVLQFGGDGYTDPRDRDSVTSDASIYRDSMAVFAQPIHQRLALGSPMRPESGVMVMNPGPAKTPVTGQAPKAIESPSLPRSSTFPPTDPAGRTLAEQDYSGEDASSRDGVGRTLAAQDYSRDGAASRASRQSRQSGRFTEHVR